MKTQPTPLLVSPRPASLLAALWVLTTALLFPFTQSATAAPEVVAWGNNYFGQTTVPVGLSNVVAVEGGCYHSLALRADGTVAVWGDNNYGQTDVPVGLSNVVTVAGGHHHSLALGGLPGRMGAPQLVGPRLLIGTVDRPS